MNNDNVKSIRELINAMENNKETSFFVPNVESWFESYKTLRTNEDYYKLYGFIMGLAACNFITTECMDILTTNLIYIESYYVDRKGNTFFIDSDGKRRHASDEE